MEGRCDRSPEQKEMCMCLKMKISCDNGQLLRGEAGPAAGNVGQPSECVVSDVTIPDTIVPWKLLQMDPPVF